ncbi:amidohydrolase [bacterium SCSIO 12643]|nr:amidohydrolase [bacterium SCSIO 12643]
MEAIKVCYIQADLHWEDIDKNLEMFTDKSEGISENVDLLILPEMFSTGFSMAPEKWSETEEGKALMWMKNMAVSKDCVVTGSVIIQEKGQYFNRLFWVQPNGEYKSYNKRHLFSFAGEDEHYTSGTERLIVDLKGFKIMPLICYDLRFPVWSRNDVDYDLAIYVANWPERRSYYWKQLLIARAIENQSYVIGVNRVGNDGNDIYHSGDSVCLDPLGGMVYSSKPGIEEVACFQIERKVIQTVREKFNFLNDQDAFQIT